MRIAIAHAIIGMVGGGERLVFLMARALRELGHVVDIYASYINYDAWSLLASSTDPKPMLIPMDPETRLTRRMGDITRAPVSGAIVAARHLLKVVRGLGYDIVIETMSNVPMDTDISYIHLPLGEDTHGGLMNFLYRAFLNIEIRRNLGKPRLTLVNSSWTAVRIYRKFGIRPNVLYPPIDNDVFTACGSYDRKDKDMVLTVSRYSPEKNLTSIVEIASMVPEAEFYIAGSVTQASQTVVHKLINRLEELKVKNLHLLFNISRNRLLRLMCNAPIYLHPLYVEHFGISIAEASAAGAVPVVYRDGGGWLDIASRIDPMLGYINVHEATHIVKTLLHNNDLWIKLSKKSTEIASDFSWDNYKSRLKNVIEKAYDIKSRRQP
ncbi:hypothetical protein GCM10007981_00860 [Thermocladium modestius]|uniref:Glycosyl transferase family 1 domain-containing protein n=1 Tax=Thermocladium modestius TaxID=62609 RepID=A0A830GS93_9CREN|nr:glycosyltransferase [Thermocladium modestius]GGP18989.1 hypothetical protein GCM10007981_00860 [Thermocladium modestius]